MVFLFKRSSDCTGSAQMCETGTDTTNTLTICLAVIIPVVVIAIVVGFFAFKAYRKNKKEFNEEANDPDFNDDNIVLPDYPPQYPSYAMAGRYNPNMMDSRTQMNNHSTDSFGNPFDEKNAPLGQHINQVSNQRPNLPHSQSNMSFQPYSENMSQFALPFGNSKEDLDKYSKNLGLDFHEFNYPINKITNSPNGSLSNSRRTSFTSTVRPLSGYMNKQTSPAKTDTTVDSSGRNYPSSQNPNAQQSPQKLQHLNDDDKEIDENAQQPSQSFKDGLELQGVHDRANENGYGYEHDPEFYPNDDTADKINTSKPAYTFHDKNDLSTSPSSSDLFKPVNSGSDSITEYEVDDNNHKPVYLNLDEGLISSEIPQLEPHEVEVPLSPEEEEQLDRMKSVYQVYFSRNGSKRIKRKDDEFISDDTNQLPHLDAQNLENPSGHAIPTLNPETNADEHLQTQPVASKEPHYEDDFDDSLQIIPPSHDHYPSTSHEPVQNKNVLSVPIAQNSGYESEEDKSDFRASVSSSVYLPVTENMPSNAGGQFAHQQFGSLVQAQNGEYQQYPQQMYQQQYNQQIYDQQMYQQYPQQYQQQYPPQGYPQQRYPQQYPPRGYGYPADMRNQQYGGAPRPLPALEKLPLPHQLNKRTSTLESMTTFTSEKKNNTLPNVQVNQNFNPIEHVSWAGKDRNDIAPSPSQIRKSIVMFNPVGLSESKTYVSKGTAKERVRAMNKIQQQQSQIPGSTSMNGPLYGFYENIPERPHGAENLIPRNGSQLDLRKNLDNVNV